VAAVTAGPAVVVLRKAVQQELARHHLFRATTEPVERAPTRAVVVAVLVLRRRQQTAEMVWQTASLERLSLVAVVAVLVLMPVQAVAVVAVAMEQAETT